MQPPNQPMQPPMGGPPPNAVAADLINIPSIVIIVLAGLGGMLGLFGLITGGGGIPPEALNNPQFTPEMKRMLTQFAGLSRWSNLLTLAFDGFLIYGALQMRQLKNFGLAMATAIVAMLPCGEGCCCIVGIPIGIWTLVVLNKPEVKSAFT